MGLSCFSGIPSFSGFGHKVESAAAVVAGSGEPAVAASFQLFVLTPPDLIDSLGTMFGGVQLVHGDFASNRLPGSAHGSFTALTP